MRFRESKWNLHVLFGGGRSRRRYDRTSGSCLIESLESRKLLSASGQPVVDTPALEALQELEVSSVQLRINNDIVVVNTSYDTVVVQPGDTVQVVGITYQGNLAAEPLDGKIAFEAYLSRSGESGRSVIDYSTGRFGAPSVASPVTGEIVSHPGLDGEWDVTSDDTRITIAMVRYFGNSSQVEGRFAVKLQVERPDFEHVLDEDISKQKLKVGKEAKIIGAWKNAGDETFHNYSEVDIYNAADMNVPVWVGVLAGTPGPGETLSGEYLNLNEQNAFNTRWTPTQAGEYVLKFYVDPENVDEETDETNNVEVVRVTVQSTKGGPKQKLNPVPMLKSDSTRAVTITELQQPVDSRPGDVSTTPSDGNTDPAELRESKQTTKAQPTNQRNNPVPADRELIDEFFTRLVDDF